MTLRSYKMTHDTGFAPNVSGDICGSTTHQGGGSCKSAAGNAGASNGSNGGGASHTSRKC